MGLWHLAWSTLVGLGFAQELINWIFRLHFIQPPYTVGTISLSLAVTLIAITSLLGLRERLGVGSNLELAAGYPPAIVDA